jgi:hypothetical protein
VTHLVNLFRMRPAGVVSKKLIGDRKIANAILSCSLRDACDMISWYADNFEAWKVHLNRAENPKQ